MPIVPGETGKLTSRVRTSALLVPLLVAIAWPGGWAFAAFVSAISVLALFELHGMMVRLGRPGSRWLTIPVGALVPLAIHSRALPPQALLPIALLVIAALALRRRRDRLGVVAVSVLELAYVPLLLGQLVALRDGVATGGAHGLEAVLFLFTITWACDTAAYVVGRAIGRTPLWPAISPNKTREGAIGGTVAAVVVAVVGRALYFPVLSPAAALAAGVLVGVALQAGDLFESRLKRKARVKDSSSVLPGHGGVLDRFDSMSFGAPVLLAFLSLV